MTQTEEIEALRRSAVEKGDLSLEGKCVEALAGDRQARIDCLRLSAFYSIRERAHNPYDDAAAQQCLEETL